MRAAWERCGEALRELAAPARDGTGGDGWVGNVLMGHSSGAHVALLVLADLLEEQMSGGINSPPALVDNDTYQWAPDHFVGLSGVYDISHHYDYEAGRGVEVRASNRAGFAVGQSELPPTTCDAHYVRWNFIWLSCLAGTHTDTNATWSLPLVLVCYFPST